MITPPLNTPSAARKSIVVAVPHTTTIAGLRAQQVPRADQRRPAVAAELRRIAVAVDHAALRVLRHEPVGRGRVGPYLEHADRAGAHARARDVADDDARRASGSFASCAGSAVISSSSAWPDSTRFSRARAVGGRPEQSPLEERVADVDQQDEVALRNHGGGGSATGEAYIGSSGKIGRVSLR